MPANFLSLARIFLGIAGFLAGAYLMTARAGYLDENEAFIKPVSIALLGMISTSFLWGMSCACVSLFTRRDEGVSHDSPNEELGDILC